jgi:hypothetical protein
MQDRRAIAARSYEADRLTGAENNADFRLANSEDFGNFGNFG